MQNIVHRDMERLLSSRYSERIGLVTSYDPDRHAAKVSFQPEGFESGWIPIHGHHIGNGWGIVIGHQIGDQVRVSFQEGDMETGAIVARLHSDEDKPPRVESGEMLLRHESGSRIMFGRDKSLTVTDAVGSEMKFDGQGAFNFKVSGATIDIDSGGVMKIKATSLEINGA